MSDSPMRSPSSNEPEEDFLFSGDTSRTPPPKSQPGQAFDSPPQTQADVAQAQKNAERVNSIPTRGLTFTQGNKQGGDPESQDGNISNPASKNYKPGEIWKNSSAVEASAKAMDNFLDRSFSLKRFGDIFDETDMKD
ncbi:MAG: hypothetical protein M1814_003657 [Vezdaea aestivalis]|nr:MAG: hypothetical protein M1814_003657 [Vezdaea aestivalis]